VFTLRVVATPLFLQDCVSIGRNAWMANHLRWRSFVFEKATHLLGALILVASDLWQSSASRSRIS